MLITAKTLEDVEKLSGERPMPEGKLVVGSLSGEKWPCTSNSFIAIRLAGSVFPVAIAVVPAPDRAARGFHAKCRVDNLRRLFHIRIVRCPQAKTSQRPDIRADNFLGSHLLFE